MRIIFTAIISSGAINIMTSFKILTKTIEVIPLALTVLYNPVRWTYQISLASFSLYILLQREKSKTLIISALKVQKNYVRLGKSTTSHRIGRKRGICTWHEKQQWRPLPCLKAQTWKELNWDRSTVSFLFHCKC